MSLFWTSFSETLKKCLYRTKNHLAKFQTGLLKSHTIISVRGRKKEKNWTILSIDGLKINSFSSKVFLFPLKLFSIQSSNICFTPPYFFLSYTQFFFRLLVFGFFLVHICPHPSCLTQQMWSQHLIRS